jgi:hypothetical protein
MAMVDRTKAGEEDERTRLVADQKQRQVPRSPDRAQNQCRGQSAVAILQMRQREPTPAEFFAERTPWKDREDEPEEYGDHGRVDCRDAAAEQDAHAEPQRSQQRQHQYHRVPAKSDTPLNQPTEKAAYAAPAVNEGDQHDGDR